jgi:hypothetical protein
MKPTYYIINTETGEVLASMDSASAALDGSQNEVKHNIGMKIHICELVAVVESTKPEVKAYWLSERERAEIATRDEEIKRLKAEVAHLAALCRG